MLASFAWLATAIGFQLQERVTASVCVRACACVRACVIWADRWQGSGLEERTTGSRVTRPKHTQALGHKRPRTDTRIHTGVGLDMREDTWWHKSHTPLRDLTPQRETIQWNSHCWCGVKGFAHKCSLSLALSLQRRLVILLTKLSLSNLNKLEACKLRTDHFSTNIFLPLLPYLGPWEMRITSLCLLLQMVWSNVCTPTPNILILTVKTCIKCNRLDEASVQEGELGLKTNDSCINPWGQGKSLMRPWVRGSKLFLFLEQVGEGKGRTDNMSYVDTICDIDAQSDRTKPISWSAGLSSQRLYDLSPSVREYCCPT